MTKIFFIIILTIFCLLSLESCKDNKEKKPTEILNDIAKDDDINIGNLNYSFSLPNDWYRIDTVLQNVYICVLLNNDNAFVPRVNILTESMHGKNHNNYVLGTKDFILNNMNGNKILDNGKFGILDKSCIWYTYDLTQNDKTRENIFYSVAINNISYNITAGFNPGGRRKYQKAVDEIVKSFRLN